MFEICITGPSPADDGERARTTDYNGQVLLTFSNLVPGQLLGGGEECVAVGEVGSGR